MVDETTGKGRGPGSIGINERESDIRQAACSVKW